MTLTRLNTWMHQRGLIAAVAVTFALSLTLMLPGCMSGDNAQGSDANAGDTPTPLEMETAASSRSPYTGTIAPNFTLNSHDERPVRLADMQGQWVVLYFYPEDDTPGCTCQATEFTNLLGRFHDEGAVVMGVSADDPETHRKFRDKYNISITLLSDPDHAVMTQYGAWVQVPVQGRQVGRVVRSTFLIDPAGRIAHHWPEVIPEGHAARVIRQLDALREHVKTDS